MATKSLAIAMFIVVVSTFVVLGKSSPLLSQESDEDHKIPDIISNSKEFILEEKEAKSGDYCGGKDIVKTIIVNQHGSSSNNGTFTRIQDAIDSIQVNNNRWVKIYIHAGTYKEKVDVRMNKPCIVLEGENRHNTIVTYGDHQKTDTSATFTSSPSNVVVTGITFKNSFNVRLRREIKDEIEEEGKILPAVAARIYGNNTAFYKCGFIGYQDTLFDIIGNHYFKKCYIQGEVDFIFGNGQSFYENCVINATGGELPGFVTAQSRNKSTDEGGFVFERGHVLGSGKINLGRAWGLYSRVIFHGTYFESIITPQGWNAWDHVGQEDKFTYAEVNCKGPGSNTKDRVKWEKKLNYSDMQKFSLSSFVNKDGWLQNLPISLNS
ncbi:hypothetical protein PIB30_056386 [Stylosanthes scabra]|uniref:pectinesterase n=1 Tax=Stylosanthes scabra TaxID=79078 RepID=A0ABU6UKZ8_9FABA|nr:hypothetical protein [Stylosanthes scabra]